MNKRKLLAYIMLVVILISTAWYTFAMKYNNNTPKPNLVIIQVNELTAGMLSCYESSRNQTPNIDLLAYQGKKYLKCFADSNFSSNKDSFSKYTLQAKTDLQNSGYQIAEFSNLSDKKLSEALMKGYSTDRCTNNAINYVKKVHQKTPFAVFMNYGSLTSDTVIAARHTELSYLGYNTSLYAIDENIGRLFKFFEDMGIAENTVFVFMATTNQTSGNPLPLIVRYPSKIQPNSVSATHCKSSDIFPAIYSMATIKIKS